MSTGIPLSRRDEAIFIAWSFTSSLTYKTEIRFSNSLNLEFWFSNAKIILSTPPATPVAPKSVLPNASGKLSYLPPPTRAPISKVLSNASKTIPE